MGKASPVTTELLKERMLDALETNFGNVSLAAKAVKISTQTHYRWLHEDPNYAQDAEDMRDMSFRKVKDKLMEQAFRRIDNGDSAVLNKMLSIYFKHIPDEMQRVSRYNNVPLRVSIKYVDNPRNQNRQIKSAEE